MDVPAQNAFGIAAASVSIDGRQVAIDFGVGRFSGALSDDLSSIDGTWTQSGREMNLDVPRTDLAPAGHQGSWDLPFSLLSLVRLKPRRLARFGVFP